LIKANAGDVPAGRHAMRRWAIAKISSGWTRSFSGECTFSVGSLGLSAHRFAPSATGASGAG